MRVLVTRPEPDAGDLARRLAALGHEPVLAPLLVVRLIEPQISDIAGIQAAIVTSGNALRALEGSSWLDALRELPLHAVGAATAEVARALGFRHVHVGPGTAEGLAETIVDDLAPAAGRLLHLCGETVAADLKGLLQGAGFTVDQAIVYRTEPTLSLPQAVIDDIGTGNIDAVMLMSPRTAETYAALIERHHLASEIRRVRHICLSSAVAQKLEGLRDLVTDIAAAPRLEEMLALLNGGAAQSRPTCG